MHNTGPTRRPIRSEFADDPEMRELVELFVSELPERVEALRASFERGDIEQMTRAAHQLKGASGGYGFAPIGAVAGAIEAGLKTLDPGADLRELTSQVDELVELCSRVAV